VPPGLSGSTGFYSLVVADATIHTMPLTVNETSSGQLDNSYSIDRWTFSVTAGEQIQFRLLAAADADIKFDLTGPNGYTAFSGSTTSSNLITLPTAGIYSVIVHTVGFAGGYAFQVEQTSVTPLTLGTPYHGTLAASGQAQLFTFTASGYETVVTLTDANEQDHNEVYVKYGSAPTRDSYTYRFTHTSAADQRVSFAAPSGTYYILVYNDLVTTSGSFTLEAQSAPFIVTGITPGHVSTDYTNTLLIAGAFPIAWDGPSFAGALPPPLPHLYRPTTVQFIAEDGTTYPTSPLPLDFIGDPSYLSNRDLTGLGNLDDTVITSVTIPPHTLCPTAAAWIR
jgi:hypothetical protein